MASRWRNWALVGLLVAALCGCVRQASDDSLGAPGGNTAIPGFPLNPATNTPLTLAPGLSPTRTPILVVSPTPLTPVNTIPPFVPTTQPGPITTTSGSTIDTQPLFTPPSDTPAFFTPGPTANPILSTTAPGTIATATLWATPTDLWEGTPAEECLYVVQDGDTFFRIAVNNDVTQAELADANPLVNPELIHPGDEIILPNCGETATVAETTPAVIDQGVQIIHVVATGETLYAIALRYGVTVDAIIAANNLADPNQLSIGQELIIPPVTP